MAINKVEVFDIQKNNMAIILQREGDDGKKLPLTQVKTLIRKKDGAFEICDSRNLPTAIVGCQLLSLGWGLKPEETIKLIINMKEGTTYRFVHRGKSISFSLHEINRLDGLYEITNTDPVRAEIADITLPEESVNELEKVFNSREKQ